MTWDPDLLQRFREGKPQALAEVYRAHAEGLARSLRAAAFHGRGFERLRSALELENTVLEVFARAFEPRARAAYDGQRPYGAFLMGIARNVLLERAREREVAVGLEVELAGTESLLSAVEGSDVAQTLEDREVEQLLQRFLTGLSDDERRLYELRFGEGLPQERAAEQLGLTRIQVRRRELALKRSLLGFLQERGYLSGLVARGWGFLRERGDA